MLICTVTIYEVLATSQGSSVNKTPVPAFAELAILCAQSLSCARHFATPLAVAHQAPTSMGFSRQECWSGLPRPPPGDLPDPGIEPTSLMSPALAGGFFAAAAAAAAKLLQSCLLAPPEKPQMKLFPSPGDFPNPGIEPTSPALQVQSLPTELPEK